MRYSLDCGLLPAKLKLIEGRLAEWEEIAVSKCFIVKNILIFCADTITNHCLQSFIFCRCRLVVIQKLVFGHFDCPLKFFDALVKFLEELHRMVDVLFNEVI